VYVRAVLAGRPEQPGDWGITFTEGVLVRYFTIGRGGLALLATTVVCLSQAAVASAGGGNSANVKLCQNGGYASLYNASTGLPFTSQGGCVSYGALRNPYSSLTASPTIDPDNGSWGEFSGFGLQPGSDITIWGTIDGFSTPIEGGPVPADGKLPNLTGTVSCGHGWSDLYAISTTSAGATITSNAINSPCG
jgi:hypothetical protein